MAQLLDSGARREFESGAVRDIQEGKGRCDLVPLNVISTLVDDPLISEILREVQNFMETKDDGHLFRSIEAFFTWRGWDAPTAILEVSKHYEDGCNKYGERNWEKGIDLHCYIDSGVRHLLKCYRGDQDEPHDRAFLWNMLGAIWTLQNLSKDDIFLPQFPTMCDLTQTDEQIRAAMLRQNAGSVNYAKEDCVQAEALANKFNLSDSHS